MFNKHNLQEILDKAFFCAYHARTGIKHENEAMRQQWNNNPGANGGVLGVSTGRGFLIQHGYLHPGKGEPS